MGRITIRYPVVLLWALMAGVGFTSGQVLVKLALLVPVLATLPTDV